MFLLAVLYKVVPKGFILPRIVFVQPGLGFSCSYPHDDGLCWRRGRVERMGIGWRIVFSLQLIGAATHCAVLWRRDVPEELSMKILRWTPRWYPHRQHGPLLSSLQHQMKMAAYKNLPFTVRQMKEGSKKWGSWVCWTQKKNQSLLILASVHLQSWKRESLIFCSQKKYWQSLT